MIWLIWVGAVLLVFVVLIVLLNFARIKIKIKGDVEGLDGRLEAVIYIWKWKLFHWVLPNLKLEEDPVEVVIKSKSNVKKEHETDLEKGQLTSLIDSLKLIIQILKDKKPSPKVYYFKEVKWETAIGSDQADQAAILNGLCWSLKSILLGGMQTFLVMDNPQFMVIPFFNKWHFETHFSCMISFQLGKAIRQALWIRKQFKRRQLLHGGTSYSRTHEDSA